MKPFSRSCKSLEVIQHPRGAASQAGINQALDSSFKTKATSWALLWLWCQVLEGRNMLLQALSLYLPTAAKSLRVFSEITMYTKFHHFSPWNSWTVSRAVHWHRGCAAGGSTFSPGAKFQCETKGRKGKRERKLLGMTRFSHVFSHSLTLKY